MEAQIPIPFENNTIIFMIMIFCIMCVAFFSSSEAALISANRIKIRNLAEKGDKNAIAAERIVSRHDRLFATILTTENMFIVLASSLAGVLSVSLWGKSGIVISTVMMTIFIVIFGEITPKTYAAQNAARVSLIVARPMEKIIMLLSLPISILTFISSSIIRMLGVNQPVNPYLFTEDELKTVLNEAERGGVLAKSEKRMIEGIFEFGDTVAGEIMVPRVDMMTVPAGAPLDEASKIINETGHSRLPVHEESVDHIVGAIYAKDVLKFCGQAGLTVKDIMRPCFFAPASQNVMKLLAELRSKRTSLAIIIDEFGGTAGMITIERLLEEIVGEIEDEFDTQIPQYEKIGEDEYTVDARMSIYEVKEKLGIAIPEGSYNTLGGFVISLVENIPSLGDIVEYEGHEFIIEKTEGYRLTRIRIRPARKSKKKSYR